MKSRGPRFGDDFRLTLITSDPALAAEADRAGVNRIGVDLEHLGKAERQAGHDTRVSGHGWDDLANIARTVDAEKLFVRINGIHSGTESEIETALELGAETLMLPDFRTAEEAGIFVRGVRRRAQVMILVETAAAAIRIRDILAVRGVDEVMFGLNDLHLQFGVSNHFEVLASPLLDWLSSEVLRAGLPLGIGGIARPDDTSLPIPADLVYAQYPRLGASGAWLARSFFHRTPLEWRLGEAIAGLRQRLSEWSVAPADALERAREDLARAAAEWRRTAAAGVF